MKPTSRLSEIDFLRFLAAVLVVLFHYLYRGFSREHLSDLEFAAEGIWARYGYLGVNLFFMISGFVILLSAEGKSPREFVVSRIVRLFPAFWVCVTATFLVIHFLDDGRFAHSVREYLVNLTMLQEIAHVPSMDGAYWTLTVELKFYFLVFMIAVIRAFRWLEWLMLGWLGASTYMLVRGSIPGLHFFLIPEQAACFIAGVAFYRIWKAGVTPFRVLLVLASFGVALAQSIHEAPTNAVFDGHIFNEWIVGGGVTLCFAIFTAVSLKWTASLGRPWMSWLGTLTYPLYLLHQNIGYVLFNRFGTEANKYALLCGVLLTVGIAAWVVAAFIERPLGGLLKRLLTRPAAGARSVGGGRGGPVPAAAPLKN